MLKIKKNEIELTVSRGAFDNLYSHMGFEIVNASKPTKNEPTKIIEKETIYEPIEKIKETVSKSKKNEKDSNK